MVGPSLDEVIDELIAAYEEKHPKSREMHKVGRRSIPGGTTRSVATFAPFPFRVVHAEGSRLIDIDGNVFIDFCGDYTAGLLGHNPDGVRTAIIQALDRGWALGTSHDLEIELAQLIKERFTSIQSVRFTSSGTEANLLAIGAALHHVGRRKVLVFEGGYHGSVLSFNTAVASSSLNVPHEFVRLEFNDTNALHTAFEGRDIGCAIVEPMKGSGGCIPATQEFLSELRRQCNATGTVLILDEIMTSRLHPGGLQKAFGVVPDLTTLGKYLASGLSFGAFGGRSDIMAHFDSGMHGSLMHSGTFNNNVLSMAAAIEVLRRYVNDAQINKVNERGDRLRMELQGIFSANGLPIWMTGIGSMLHVHAADERWINYLFYSLLAEGFYVSPRGFMGLSFAVSEEDCEALIGCLKRRASDASEYIRPAS
jgi:glutamate-1-semialdehyde 2,1-aminomutase